MPEVLKQLLSSKKFLILAAGIVVTLLTVKLGWDEATATKVVGLFAMYLGSQGLSDLGKGRAQIEAPNLVLGEKVGALAAELRKAAERSSPLS